MMKRTVGIIGGKGIMGHFMATVFRKNGCRVFISDVQTRLSNIDLTKKCDVVIVSVPIDVTEKVIREIVPHLRKEQLLCDVTSLKVFPTKEMQKGTSSVIGLHPMFRPGSRGLSQQKIILCPVRCEAKEKKWLRKIFEAGGANVLEMTPRKHDQLMAIIQVLIHFHTIVLGHTMRNLKVDVKETMKAMSPIYRLEFDVISRIFAQDASLYANILMRNPETPQVLKTFLTTTENLKAVTVGKQTKKFVKEFEKTSQFLGRFSKQALLESEKILTFFEQ